MERVKQLRRLRTSLRRLTGIPHFKKLASNSCSAIQDTFYSTKDTFERHRVVFTVGTSIASVATAFLGYSLRHIHDTRVARRLDSIEQAMKSNNQIERDEIKKIVGTGGFSTAACAATAGTTLVIGYALGWRGGRWYANRKFRREQMKLLGQVKPNRWQLQFLRKPNLRFIRLPSIRDKLSKTRAQNVEEEALSKNRPAPIVSKQIQNI